MDTSCNYLVSIVELASGAKHQLGTRVLASLQDAEAYANATVAARNARNGRLEIPYRYGFEIRPTFLAPHTDTPCQFA